MAWKESEMLVYTISTIVFLIALLYTLSFRRNDKHKLPPGNTCLPLIGETFSFMKSHSPTKREEFMEHRISRYGKIFSTHLFGKRSIVSADPELNRFVLKSEGKLFQHGFSLVFQKLLGSNAIIFMHGEVHKHMRSTLMNFVNSKRTNEDFVQDVDQIASRIISSWKEGHVISAKEEASKFTFYIMVKKILSMTQENPEIEKLAREYKSLIRGIVSNPLYMHLPGSLYQKALQSRDYIIKTFKKEIEVRKEKKHCANAGLDKDDFLGWLLKNTDYPLEKICDFLLIVLLAGHDTTSRAISLLIYFLERCPKAIEQLQEEQLQIVRSKKQHGGQSKLILDDIKGMEFTRCVINEMLRLGNVVSFLQRKATTDVQFKSYTIPQGRTIQLHLASVNLDPSIYEDPECFNPWRWLPSSNTKVNNSFMPFGGGIRACPGAEFARLEMSVFLHHLILKHDWELAEPDHPMVVRVVEFSKGLPIKVRAISTNL